MIRATLLAIYDSFDSFTKFGLWPAYHWLRLTLLVASAGIPEPLTRTKIKGHTPGKYQHQGRNQAHFNTVKTHKYAVNRPTNSSLLACPPRKFSH